VTSSTSTSSLISASNYCMYQENVLVWYHYIENFPRRLYSRSDKSKNCREIISHYARLKKDILTLSVSLSLCPNKNAIFTVELYKLSKLYLLAQVLLIAVRASWFATAEHIIINRYVDNEQIPVGLKIDVVFSGCM